jgi:hypothetical protein
MRWSLIAVASLLGLTACGNSQDGFEGYDAIRQYVRAQTAPPPQPLTRAMIGDFTDPLLYAALPSRNAEAFLGIAMVDGPIVTWWTQNQVALILRDGALIGTRGLGEDLMASSAPDMRVARGTSRRINQYIGPDDTTLTLAWACEVTELGMETVALLGQAWTGKRVDETCDGSAGKLVNSYWLDRDGSIRQARQWVSPSVGYITIQRLID